MAAVAITATQRRWLHLLCIAHITSYSFFKYLSVSAHFRPFPINAHSRKGVQGGGCDRWTIHQFPEKLPAAARLFELCTHKLGAVCFGV